MKAPLPVSVLLLARDETADLEALIPSLAFAREVVVVWDESGDPATRAAAERLGARVCSRRLEGFGPQRQFGLEQCTQEWVLWIDSDERLSSASVATISRVVAGAGGDAPVSFVAGASRDAPVSGVAPSVDPALPKRQSPQGATPLTGATRAESEHAPSVDPALPQRQSPQGATPLTGAALAEDAYCLALRTSFFLGRRIRHCGWGNEWLPRLFTRRGARFDSAAVHERVILDGARELPRDGEFAIEHHSYPDWASCVRKLERYAHAGAERAARAGRRAGPVDVLVRPPLRFFRQYVLQLGVLDGGHGLVLCALAAWQVGLKYAELWAMSRPRR